MSTVRLPGGSDAKTTLDIDLFVELASMADRSLRPSVEMDRRPYCDVGQVFW